MTASPARFPIRFDRWFAVLSSVLVLRPSDSYVEVNGNTVSVRMSWGFQASFPRSSVRAINRLDTAPLSRGVHGFAGRWLVNGSGDNIVAIDLMPIQAARVLGFPVQLRQLMVSVDDPQALAARLQAT